MGTTVTPNCTDCCGGECVTTSDVASFLLDVESDCATMDCPDVELNANGDNWAGAVPGGCSIQVEPPGMSCVNGVYSLRLTIPTCVSVNLTGTVISDPGDPVVIYFPPVNFTGSSGVCCHPGTFSVEATATES